MLLATATSRRTAKRILCDAAGLLAVLVAGKLAMRLLEDVGWLPYPETLSIAVPFVLACVSIALYASPPENPHPELWAAGAVLSVMAGACLLVWRVTVAGAISDRDYKTVLDAAIDGGLLPYFLLIPLFCQVCTVLCIGFTVRDWMREKLLPDESVEN